MREVLLAKGVIPDSVEHVTQSLVRTSLRGTDSHGVNLFPHYCRAVDGGRVNKSPDISFEQTGPATGCLDADHAFGHHAGAVAMDHAVELAAATGMGAVATKNSTHFGAAAYFALRAAEKGFLGFAFTSADALVKAHGAKEAFFGTNPICFCAPMQDEDPLCLDMATSQVSWNRIKNARRTNESLAPGLAFDRDGDGVVDPHQARSLAPAGSYKGFGLGMMVDVLCALLADGPISKDIMAMYDTPIDARRLVPHLFMVIDIKRFVGVERFAERLQQMAARVRRMQPLEGSDGSVMVPGDPEKRCQRIRSRQGIPMDEEKFAEFLAVSPGFSEAVRAS